MFQSIPQSGTWTKVEQVTKGYSGDQKYHIWDQSGAEYLLRVSPMSFCKTKREQYAVLEQIAQRDIPASKPISFGKLDEEHVYLLLTWLEGQDAEDYLQNADAETAYRLGIQGGQILKRLQTVEVPPRKEPWVVAYQHMVDDRIRETEACTFLPKTDILADYIRKHRNLVPERPAVFMHGDYHRGNMIVDAAGNLGIIDFDRAKTADPYREFKCFQWNVLVSPEFASGIIDGYFGGKVPEDFFPILALFAAEGLVHYVNWSAPYGDEELALAIDNYKKQLLWFDDFRRIVPTWYVGCAKK